LRDLRAIALAPKNFFRGAVGAKAKYHTGPSRLAYRAEDISATGSPRTEAVTMTSFSSL
jgi:hypothetical protein